MCEAYLKPEAFHHIEFEAKQVYYDIVHKPFSQPF